MYNFLSDGVDLSGWFVTPKVGEEGVWELGWTKDSTTYPRPANSYVVYVWAKAV